MQTSWPGVLKNKNRSPLQRDVNEQQVMDEKIVESHSYKVESPIGRVLPVVTRQSMHAQDAVIIPPPQVLPETIQEDPETPPTIDEDSRQIPTSPLQNSPISLLAQQVLDGYENNTNDKLYSTPPQKVRHVSRSSQYKTPEHKQLEYMYNMLQQKHQQQQYEYEKEKRKSRTLQSQIPDLVAGYSSPTQSIHSLPEESHEHGSPYSTHSLPEQHLQYSPAPRHRRVATPAHSPKLPLFPTPACSPKKSPTGPLYPLEFDTLPSGVYSPNTSQIHTLFEDQQNSKTNQSWFQKYFCWCQGSCVAAQ